MDLLGEYKNGNYVVAIYEDGTKIRYTEHDKFIPEFPESMDLKITNHCDMSCLWCHENSTREGRHGDILHADFINSLRPFTEVAIGGGNPLSHPDLHVFLERLKQKNIIANMTVNQRHFLNNKSTLQELSKGKLIHGLGVSLIKPTDELITSLKLFPNAVLHIINGVVEMEDLKKLYDHDFKVLILGYKQLRRGNDYYSEKVEANKALLANEVSEIIGHFKVVSFDNLAIKQLNIRGLMSDEQWDEFYMGDDGQYTMYIDLVEKEFASSSTSSRRYALLDDIVYMFDTIKMSAQL